MHRIMFAALAGLLAATSSAGAQYLGNYSANRYDQSSTANPYGAGNPYDANSINNRYGQYGSPYSNRSVNNPYATDAPKLYDGDGNYRGRLSSNLYDPDSVSNPYGRYGNRFSPDSIKNRFGAGNPHSPNSPTNPYEEGLRIQSDDDD